MPAGAILIAAAVAWVCAVILIVAASRRPRVGALVERAVTAAGLALFGTVYGLIATHTDLNLTILDSDTAKTIIRTGVVILVGVLPTIWVVLWATGNLGSDEPVETTMQRIEDKLDANTVISQQASDHADNAYHEANSANEKIATQGAAIVTQGVALSAADSRIEATVDDTAGKVTDLHDHMDKP